VIFILNRILKLDLKKPLLLYIDLKKSLLLLIKFLNTLIKKKLYYKIVFIKEIKLKKKINSNIKD